MRVCGLGALERVGADQLTEPVGLVRSRTTHRPHLVQHDHVAALSELERGFTASQPATHDVNVPHAHDLARAVFLRAGFFFTIGLPAFASRSCTACAIVTESGFTSFGSVARMGFALRSLVFAPSCT